MNGRKGETTHPSFGREPAAEPTPPDDPFERMTLVLVAIGLQLALATFILALILRRLGNP